MAFIDDFAAMMTDTITHAALSGRDGYGAPTYGSGTSYDCRVVRKNKIVRTPEGSEVVSTAHVWVQGSPAITPEDQVTLSTGETPVIASVERFQDEDGASHTKVYFL